MKKNTIILVLILLIGFISCEKENNDAAFKLRNGAYMGSFKYDNNQFWEAFIVQNENFEEYASGGVLFQKAPVYPLVKGTYEIINDSIYFKNIQLPQSAIEDISDYDKDFVLMGSYYIEEYSDSTIFISRIAQKGRLEYDLSYIE